MKLPSFKRIFKSDFKEEYQDLIESLSFILNNGFEVVYDTLNKKVNLDDNILVSVNDVLIETDSTGQPKNPTNYNLSILGKIKGVDVMKYDNLTNSTVYPTSGIFICFTQTNSGILINNVTGLPINSSIQLRIRSWG